MIYGPRAKRPRKYVVQVQDAESGQWATITQPVTRATAFELRDRLNEESSHEYHYRVFNRYTQQESV